MLFGKNPPNHAQCCMSNNDEEGCCSGEDCEGCCYGDDCCEEGCCDD